MINFISFFSFPPFSVCLRFFNIYDYVCVCLSNRFVWNVCVHVANEFDRHAVVLNILSLNLYKTHYYVRLKETEITNMSCIDFGSARNVTNMWENIERDRDQKILTSRNCTRNGRWREMIDLLLERKEQFFIREKCLCWHNTDVNVCLFPSLLLCLTLHIFIIIFIEFSWVLPFAEVWMEIVLATSLSSFDFCVFSHHPPFFFLSMLAVERKRFFFFALSVDLDNVATAIQLGDMCVKHVDFDIGRLLFNVCLSI